MASSIEILPFNQVSDDKEKKQSSRITPLKVHGFYKFFEIPEGPTTPKLG